MSVTKVTVVIPTRERPETLGACIRTALTQDYPNLEVLVSDNASGPETRQIVESFGDPRLRYVNTGKRLSMSGNYEFADAQVEEGWIVQIGDDDGLLPNSLSRPIALLEKSRLEALSSPICDYRWPSVETRTGGALSVPFMRGTAVVDARKAIDRVMDWRIYPPPLPYLYTGGIVSADLVRRIRSVDGRFFHSQIPDVYSSFAICSVVDKFLTIKEPFALSGTSKSSNGRAQFNGNARGFLNEGNMPFHDRLKVDDPSDIIASLPALYIDCFFQSAYLRNDRTDLSDEFILSSVINQTDSETPGLVRWGRRFAEKCGLDYERVVSQGRRLSIGRAAERFRARLENTSRWYRLARHDTTFLSDVYQASIAAETLLVSRPSLTSSLLSAGRRVIAHPGEVRRLAGTFASRRMQNPS